MKGKSLLLKLRSKVIFIYNIVQQVVDRAENLVCKRLKVNIEEYYEAIKYKKEIQDM